MATRPRPPDAPSRPIPPPAQGLVGVEEAFARIAADRLASRWPQRGADCRLEPTARPIVRPSFTIARTDRVFTIGSCFARNIEEYLDRLGFEVPTLRFSVPIGENPVGRPSGILNKYTPPTIWQEIDRTARALGASSEDERLTIVYEPLLDMGDGSAIDVELVGFRPVTLARAQARRRQIYDLYRLGFECEVVTITLGLVEAWLDRETGRYIVTAPTRALMARYPGRFFACVLDHSDCQQSLRESVRVLKANGHPDKRLLVTTSPVPLTQTFTGEDVLVANGYAKATLRSVCGAVSRAEPAVDYFPSYEMVTLTRSDGVWEDDLTHVTDRFVGQVVRHLVDHYVPDRMAGGLGVADQMWAAIRAGDIAGALELAREEPTLGVEPTVATLYAIALLREEVTAEGRNLLLEHAPHAELTADQAMHVAPTLYGMRRFELCIAVCEQAIERDPDATADSLVGLQVRRALALDEVGRGEDADVAIGEALARRRTLIALNAAGQLQLRRGHADAASEFFGESLQQLQALEKRSVVRGEAHGGLALAAMMTGDRQSAASHLELARIHAPNGILTARAASEAERLMK